MKRKRYINWMKDVVLNVYEIKIFLNDYAIFQSRLFDNNANKTFICADIESEVSFMNESLLFLGNLFDRLISTSSVTMRGISDERIVDKQIHLSIHVTDSDDIAKNIETTSYVTKDIKTEVIIDINVLERSQNKITLHLHTKKMQLESSHVLLDFTSSGTMSINFNVAIIALRSCMKATTNKATKKTVKFATKTSEKETSLSIKLDRISQLSHRQTPANSVLSNANWHRKCAFNNALKSVTEMLEWRRLVALSTTSIMPIRHHVDARSTRRRTNKSYMSSKSCRRRLNQFWR